MSFLSETSGNKPSGPDNTTAEESKGEIDTEGWDNPNWHNDKAL